jgi:hypothetical protein
MFSTIKINTIDVFFQNLNKNTSLSYLITLIMVSETPLQCDGDEERYIYAKHSNVNVQVRSYRVRE